ncbi:MAG: 50S ribosomal protein L23 [Polyangiales bacterium]
MRVEEVVRRPLLTEKSVEQRESVNQYCFEVHPLASKVQVRQAVETLFRVRVDQVRTLIVRGKVKRMGRSHGKRRNWKKAMVTLPAGEVIDLFEGA